MRLEIRAVTINSYASGERLHFGRDSFRQELRESFAAAVTNWIDVTNKEEEVGDLERSAFQRPAGMRHHGRPGRQYMDYRKVKKLMRAWEAESERLIDAKAAREP